MPGQPCVSGNVAIWTQASVDLSAYAGQGVQLRFRFGSDSLNHYEGWCVDDVILYAPTFVTEPTTPTGLTLYYFGGNLILRWDADSNTHYRIFSGTTPDNPLETLEGTSQTNQFLLGGNPAAARKFYSVVGWAGN